MRIAVTNDDGVHGLGIAAMARQLADEGHDVVVVCPDRDMSGVGTSTGADLRSSSGVRVCATEVAGVPAFAVDGPPALCTLLALRGLAGAPAEFVVSGVNAGPNLGVSTLHSGTVGAAMTASNFGVPGLAVSLVLPPGTREGNFATAATVAAAVVERMTSAPAERVLVANLNVPDVPLAALRGVRSTTLDVSPGFRATGVDRDPQRDGSERVKFRYERLESDPPESTDVGAVGAGFASIGWLTAYASVPPPTWHADVEADVAGRRSA